jgi:RimJ/RimL family protein N-acetyltransferase
MEGVRVLIKLERFTYEEIPQLISWVPSKEFLLQWGGPSYTYELMEKQFLNDINMMLEENPKSLMFSAKLIASNETVGHIQLLGIDRVNMSARIGRVLVGEKEYRSKGIGLQMINAILDIAFNKLNLHRVDLGVFDFNESAIACYKKAGFIIEGNLRECRKMNGQYWSLLNMSILEDEYRNRKNVI